ncbi:MAG: dihydropteroate synthase [Myxococcales bacterium]|nr:dihydropteroate synthase [Myxococcales bacterium]
MRRLPELWGVLNVTPDSFSDGGRYFDVAAACARVRELVALGADVIDVGGESTRPPGTTYGEGYADVDVQEELRRVLPAIEAAVADGARVSIDTTKLEVARHALDAGASIVNFVGERASDELLALVAEEGATIVLMHNVGRGQVVSVEASPAEMAREVEASLLREAQRAEGFGIPGEHIYLDPGIGFAKTAVQSAGLLGSLRSLVRTGYPILVGASRKSFIGELAREPNGARPAPSERLGGSIAAAIAAARAGARAVRVHDVRETRQALLVWAKITEGEGE